MITRKVSRLCIKRAAKTRNRNLSFPVNQARPVVPVSLNRKGRALVCGGPIDGSVVRASLPTAPVPFAAPCVCQGRLCRDKVKATRRAAATGHSRSSSVPTLRKRGRFGGIDGSSSRHSHSSGNAAGWQRTGAIGGKLNGLVLIARIRLLAPRLARDCDFA